MRLAALGLLALSCAPAFAAPRSSPSVAIAIPESSLTKPCGDRLETALRRALGRSKRVRLVPRGEDAQLAVEVLECSRLDQTTRSLDYEEDSGLERERIVTSEFEVGVGRESIRTFILRARLVSGPRFIDVASGPDDHDLDAAARSVRRAMDKALAERGAWLLERPR